MRSNRKEKAEALALGLIGEGSPAMEKELDAKVGVKAAPRRCVGVGVQGTTEA